MALVIPVCLRAAHHLRVAVDRLQPDHSVLRHVGEFRERAPAQLDHRHRCLRHASYDHYRRLRPLCRRSRRDVLGRGGCGDRPVFDPARHRHRTFLGLVVGVANGFFIAKIGISPFVTTLATQVLVTGFLFVGTAAQPVYGVPESFTVLGLGRIGPVPIPTIIFAIVALVTWAILRFTTLGHYIYIVGGNKQAARLAGIDVDRILLITYALGGLFAAVAGIVLLGQTNIGQPASATDWPLTAIAAVVVGGVPLSGGVGQVWSAVLGTLLLGIIANALNLLGVSPFWQPAVTGAVILVAVGLDSYHRKQRERR